MRVVPKRVTQKIDTDPCGECGTDTWECRVVTMGTLWPWSQLTDQLSRWQRDTWPWVGGITVTCVNCRRTWFGNASMQRFDDIRDRLPPDGGMVVVQFAKLGPKKSDGWGALPVRRLARPRRRLTSNV